MMRPTKLQGLFFLCIVLASSPVQAANLLTPFVSHLDAVINGDEVLLNWRDSPNLENEIYEIWRSSEEINTESFGKAQRLAVVSEGIEHYTDQGLAPGSYWYAITAVSQGIRQEILIPYRNLTVSPLRIASAASQPDDAASLVSLTVHQKEGRMIVEYQADRDERNITLLRSPVPFKSIENLDNAVILRQSTGRSGIHEDFPIPGTSWYYAALDTILLQSGSPEIWKKAAFFQAAFEENPSHRMRTAPLPVLRVTRRMNDGMPIPGLHTEMPVRRNLSPQASEALREILKPSDGRLWVAPEPQILNIDKGVSENPRQIRLQKILDGPFAEGEWPAAAQALKTMSSANGIDSRTHSRIQFYLGECQYYQGEMQAAFLSFLLASDHHYPEAVQWMNRIYQEVSPLAPASD